MDLTDILELIELHWVCVDFQNSIGYQLTPLTQLDWIDDRNPLNYQASQWIPSICLAYIGLHHNWLCLVVANWVNCISFSIELFGFAK